MKHHDNNRGFIALMSVVIMSAIVLVMIFTLGASVFFSRFSVLDGENKRVSLALAEACTNTAMLKIAQDAAYTKSGTGECVSVSDTCGVSGATKTCRICHVSKTGSVYTIRTRAVYKGAYTNLSAAGTLGSTNFTVSSWGETSANPDVSCALP